MSTAEQVREWMEKSKVCLPCGARQIGQSTCTNPTACGLLSAYNAWRDWTEKVLARKSCEDCRYDLFGANDDPCCFCVRRQPYSDKWEKKCKEVKAQKGGGE